MRNTLANVWLCVLGGKLVRGDLIGVLASGRTTLYEGDHRPADLLVRTGAEWLTMGACPPEHVAGVLADLPAVLAHAEAEEFTGARYLWLDPDDPPRWRVTEQPPDHWLRPEPAPDPPKVELPPPLPQPRDDDGSPRTAT